MYLRFHVADQYSPFLSQVLSRRTLSFTASIFAGPKSSSRAGGVASNTPTTTWARLWGRFMSQGVLAGIEGKHAGHGESHRGSDGQRIEQLDWMSPETKQQALAKLEGIRNKIGYPDKWRDYSSVSS